MDKLTETRWSFLSLYDTLKESFLVIYVLGIEWLLDTGEDELRRSLECAISAGYWPWRRLLIQEWLLTEV